jgi:hypothetical protein
MYSNTPWIEIRSFVINSNINMRKGEERGGVDSAPA